MSPNSSNRADIRLAELIAALSLATDLGMGQPTEFALSACILAVRLAEKCGYSEEALREVYYQALLRYIGCNAETDWLASIVGDEQGLRVDFAQIDNGNSIAVINTFVHAIQQAHAGESTFNITRAVAHGLLASSHIKPMFSGHWEAVLELEPGSHETLTPEQFDQACRTLADFVDIKSTYTLTHSSGVADLAVESARRAGLPESDITMIRRAALLKEIGRTGITSNIWEKTGSLTEREWERVRLHTYYTERILSHTPALASVGALASLHHERLDGSGYHRGLPSASQSLAARILSAADVYHSLTEARPYRSAFQPEAAAQELQKLVRAAQLDGDAVSNVLATAGHRVNIAHREIVAGLSERELEVLRLLSHGQTMKQIAMKLVISEKTVDSHIQHIYNKISVSTRAGATMFAMEHQLLTAE